MTPSSTSRRSSSRPQLISSAPPSRAALPLQNRNVPSYHQPYGTYGGGGYGAGGYGYDGRYTRQLEQIMGPATKGQGSGVLGKYTGSRSGSKSVSKGATFKSIGSELYKAAGKGNTLVVETKQVTTFKLV